MNRCGLWVVGFLLLNGAFAQDGRQIIQKAEQKMKSLNTMQVRVQGAVQQSMGANKMTQTITSTLSYKKPNKMAMDLKTTGGMPMNLQMYSDGTMMWVYFPGTKQYQKMPAPPSTQGVGMGPMSQMSPLMLLNSNVAKEKDTIFKVLKSTKVNGKDAYVIEARPKNPSEASQGRALIYIGKSDSLVYKVEFLQSGRRQMQGPSGQSQMMDAKQSITLSFNYLGVNKPIPDSKFTFKPPAGAKELQTPK